MRPYLVRIGSVVCVVLAVGVALALRWQTGPIVKDGWLDTDVYRFVRQAQATPEAAKKIATEMKNPLRAPPADVYSHVDDNRFWLSHRRTEALRGKGEPAMFRRYFSRVLFAVAAFVFVVLWAYAHGSSLGSQTGWPSVSKSGSTVTITTWHNFTLTTNHSTVEAHLAFENGAREWIPNSDSDDIVQWEAGTVYYDYQNIFTTWYPNGNYNAYGKSNGTADGGTTSTNSSAGDEPFTVP
jgi:hypothetical protein